MEPSTAALAGMLGVLVGALIAINSDRAKARREFLARQLSEFYAPMLGIREEVRVLSEFRQKVRQQNRDVWQELCKIGRANGDPEELKKLLQPEREKLESRIEYDNTQLSAKLIPAYHRMVELFRDKYWLAEFETRAYFTTLVEYVEGWDRFLSRSHSAEVLKRVEVQEEQLLPFYGHLKQTHDRLRERVKNALD